MAKKFINEDHYDKSLKERDPIFLSIQKAKSFFKRWLNFQNKKETSKWHLKKHQNHITEMLKFSINKGGR